MRTRLPYRIVAATLSLLLVAGIVLPVVQAACAADMQANAGAHHASMESSVASVAGGGTQAATSHTHDGDPVATEHEERHKATPSPCLTGCESCCIVETPSTSWTTIRVVNPHSLKGDVPLRYDVVTIILPREDSGTPRYISSDASPPISPVRLHVWKATFLT